MYLNIQARQYIIMMKCHRIQSTNSASNTESMQQLMIKCSLDMAKLKKVKFTISLCDSKLNIES